MKRITIVIFIIYIITANGYVTYSTKSDDVTTLLPVNKTDNDVDPKFVEKKQSSVKSLNVFDDSVYLDDVVFAKNNLNWTKEEEPCLNRTLLLLKSLQNFTLWAVWNWDSISSEPQGLFYGSRYHLGNFDECMSPPWYEDHPELKSQYCLADIVIDRTDYPKLNRISNPFEPYQSALHLFKYKSLFLRTLNKLTWGVCVPDVCQPESVKKLIEILLAHSHLGAVGMQARISVNEECQSPDNAKPFDTPFYVFVSLTVFLIAISLVCTYLNRNKRDLDQNIRTLREKIISAFDLKLNAEILLRYRNEDLNILHGIKCISMVVIVISHQFGVLNGGAISNGLQVDEDVGGLFGQAILHDDVAVDTFFLISGFLLTMTFMKLKTLPSLFDIIFSRYMRLIIAYAIIIFYTCAIYPYTGSGPLWNRAIEADTVQCRRNWWLNLLMVSNYVDSENICLVISWYIPCDFHFFLITVLLLWIYRKSPCSGKLLFVIITVAAIITPGIVNYINDLPPIQLFTYEFLTNARTSKQFQLTYIKSHTRYAASLVGVFSACLYTYCCSSERFKRISQKWAITGACIGLSVMGVILFTAPVIRQNYSALQSAMYAALNRPVFACGAALLIICCSLGNVPILKGFLSWYPFVPLSKLTYGIYLTHTLFITRNVYVTRNPQHHDVINILTSAFGIMFQTLLVAFFLWLLAEAPVCNLLKIRSMRPTINNSKTEEQNAGYLHDNLPKNSTVEVISSKI